jgi:hypothetical protein
MGGGATPPQRVADVLRNQAQVTGDDSPFYSALLIRSAADVVAGGPCWAVLEGHEDDRFGTALPLRFLGAVQRLVLEGRAPDLAARWPPAAVPTDEAWRAFTATLVAHHDELRRSIERPVQTNEVGRCAALLGGFLLVARATGLPLRVLEVGASAGLNLRWDHYAYAGGGRWWGDPASPVRFEGVFDGAVPPLEQAAEVVERRGCDPSPIDPTTDEGRLTLRSFVWPDQRHRIALLDAAIAVAREVPVEIDRARALDWLDAQLAERRDGVATVVFHSIVLQYLPRDDRPRLVDRLAAAGAVATRDAPIAWLRMEPGGAQADVHLTTWPGGEDRHLARCGYHGRPVRWLGDRPVDR